MLNLIVQEMPRLPVDVNLVFINRRPNRQVALGNKKALEH